MAPKKAKEPKTQKPKVERGRPPALTLDMVIASNMAKGGGKNLTLRELLPRLGSIQCTQKEVAAICGVTEKTLIEFFKREPTARELFENGKLEGVASLRRKQFALADKNATMGIFLGMNYAGQEDKRTLQGPKGKPLIPGEIDIESLSTEQLLALKARLVKGK